MIGSAGAVAPTHLPRCSYQPDRTSVVVFNQVRPFLFQRVQRRFFSISTYLKVILAEKEKLAQATVQQDHTEGNLPDVPGLGDGAKGGRHVVAQL